MFFQFQYIVYDFNYFKCYHLNSKWVSLEFTVQIGRSFTTEWTIAVLNLSQASTLNVHLCCAFHFGVHLFFWKLYRNLSVQWVYMYQTNLFICMSIRKTELISTRFCINKSMRSFIDIMLYLLPIWIEKLNCDFFSLNYLILEFKTQSLLSSGSQTRCKLGQFWKTRRTISVSSFQNS